MNGYSFDKLKVFVVAKDQHMRRLVVTILQAFGTAQIREAADHEGAWKILHEFVPDIVFLDWQEETALELVKRIRTSEQSPDPFMPIILLTAQADAEHLRLARDAGVDEFLTKPTSARALMARIVAVIENPRPFVRTNSYFGPCRRYRASEEYRGPDQRLLTVAKRNMELAAA